MNFNEVWRTYSNLKEQFDQGRLSADEFEKRVNEMTVTDAQGNVWQIGVSSGKWYRYDGQNWVEDEPRDSGRLNPASAPPVAPQIAQPTRTQNQPRKNMWISGLLIIGILGVCGAIVAVGVWVIWRNTPVPVPFAPPIATSLALPSVVPSISSATPVIPLALTPESGNTALPGFPPDLVLFQDDFSNANSGWDDVVKDDYATQYMEGIYRVWRRNPGGYIWANPNKSFPGDVHIEVDAKKTYGSQFDEFGLICRYSKNSDDTYNYYYFAISVDGLGVIYKVDHDDKNLIITNPPANRSDVIKPDMQVNRIRADCVGDTLSLSVNGQLLVNATDSSFTNGDIGLRADSETGQTEVIFDNLIVLKPGY